MRVLGNSSDFILSLQICNHYSTMKKKKSQHFCLINMYVDECV